MKSQWYIKQINKKECKDNPDAWAEFAPRKVLFPIWKMWVKLKSRLKNV